MDAPYQLDPDVFASVLLAERLVFGFLFAAHGTQKLLGWFRGAGLDDTGGFFEQLGFRPGRAFAAAAGLTELTAGLLIALGFLGPVGPALLLSVMVVAVITVHRRNGLLATSNGSELPLLYVVVAVGLAFTGFGRYSLDAALGIADWSPWVSWTALGGGALAGFTNVLARRLPTPSPAPLSR
ncbi:MAG TPA: DoxX family protein [Gemmatimonadaceae bacterium]|nr:DoxX family protein [Gemmatimonadaceae bacterium]